jgi:O-antigen ligase
MWRSGGAWVLALVPVAAWLVVDPAGWQPFGPSKWLAISVLGVAGFGLVALHRPLRMARRAAIAWSALLVWMAVAAALGQDRLYAWTGTPERHFGWLTWLLCAALFCAGTSLAASEADLVVAGFVAAGAGVGVWATAEAFGWQPIAVAGSTARLLGPLGSADYLGAVTALALPLAIGVAVDRARARWMRIVAGIGSITLAIAAVGSGTRGSWFGLAVAAVVVAVIHRRWLVAHPRTTIGAAAAAAVAVGATLALSPAGGRVSDAFATGEPGGVSRLDEWRVASTVLAHHPLVGVGPEGYRVAFHEGVSASYEAAHGRAVLPDRAHDGLLDVGVAAGLPGLVLFIGLVVIVGRFAVRALRRGPQWLAGAGAGLIAFAAQQIFLFPIAEIDTSAWLLAGIVVAATASASEMASVEVPRPLVLVPGALAAVALVAGSLDVAADHSAKTALDELGSGQVRAALVDADRAAARRPDVVRYHLLAARAAEAARPTELTEAIRRVDDALAVSRRDPVALAQKAHLLVEQASQSGLTGDISSARAYVQRLVDDDPNNADLELQLGTVAALAGDGPAATRAWTAAERLAPTSPAPAIDLALFSLQHHDLVAARAAISRALARSPHDDHALQVKAMIDAAQQPNGSSG